MPDDQPGPVRDDELPADPVSGQHMGYVALHEMYKAMRGAGWGILAAASYIAAYVRLNGEDPPQDES